MARTNKVPEHPCAFCGEPTTNPLCCNRTCGARYSQKLSKGRKGKKEPVADRYMYYVRPGLRKNDCWGWTSFYSTSGYPMVWDGDKGKHESAMRVSYELFKGPIKKGHVVAKTCEGRGCTNPFHLISGERGKVVGMILHLNKKSAKYGDDHASTKLPVAGAELIRKLHREGRRPELIEVCKRMSEHYGMSEEYLRALARTKPGRRRKMRQNRGVTNNRDRQIEYASGQG